MGKNPNLSFNTRSEKLVWTNYLSLFTMPFEGMIKALSV